MSDGTGIREVLEAIRRHVERATAGTGLQATSMTVDLRFGLRTDDRSRVRPVLRTHEDKTKGAPHSLRLSVSLSGEEKDAG
jgi:hypothetical protein